MACREFSAWLLSILRPSLVAGTSQLTTIWGQSAMEPIQPNHVLDQPANNVVRRDRIHMEALRKEWAAVEALAQASPKYHFNPYKK